MEYLMKSQQKDDQQDDKLLFGLVLFDNKEGSSDIEECIKNLLEIDYPASKLKIVICSYLSEDRNPNRYVNYANILLDKFRHTKLLLNHKLERDQDVDYNAFDICKHADYFVKIKCDQKIKPNFFRGVNKVYKKNSLVKQNDVVAIPKKLVSKTYLDFNDYDKMSEYLLEQADNNNSLENIE